MKDSGSYSVYVFAYTTSGGVNTYYPIAKKTSGIVFTASQFTPGVISGLLMTAVDSNVVSRTTRYKFSITPYSTIPSNSILTITFPISISLT